MRLNPRNHKVVAGDLEQSSVSNIYAIGDVLDVSPCSQLFCCTVSFIAYPVPRRNTATQGLHDYNLLLPLSQHFAFAFWLGSSASNLHSEVLFFST